MTCEPAPAPEQGGAGSGAQLERRILGEQGYYVRLESSSAAYDGGVFGFSVAVRNQSNLAMGTSDGVASHADGLRVFFLTAPVVTEGSGEITVANPTGSEAFTQGNQPYYQYAGGLLVDAILSPKEVSWGLWWEFNVPSSVVEFRFVVAVDTETPPGAIETIAPQITGIQPSELVPGDTAIVTGYNFDPTPGNNRVTVGGVQAEIITDDTSSASAAAAPAEAQEGGLRIRVPCTAGGDVDVQAGKEGMRGRSFSHALRANRHVLKVGDAVVIEDADKVGCTELARENADQESRYVVAVFNTDTDYTSRASFTLSPGGTAAVPPQANQARPHAAASAPPINDPLSFAWEQRIEKNHLDRLRRDRQLHDQLRLQTEPAAWKRGQAAPIGPERDIRVQTPGPTCSAYAEVRARLVHANGKVAIYEDPQIPDGVEAANNAQVLAYYLAIAQQFNTDIEPIVRQNFSDPLLQDLDQNGVVILLFTPRVLDIGAEAFQSPCDQYPRTDGRPGSNAGEYLYVRSPEVVGTGYNAFTPARWYWMARQLIAHELKHLAASAWRVKNNAADQENEWLEEGTARMAEELWARTAVYGQGWKGEITYAASIRCDNMQTDPACNAASSRRPALTLNGNFTKLYSFMASPATLSPFGRTPADDGHMYAASWSLLRYAADRYGATEGGFLRELTQTSATGLPNLTARAGTTTAQLMGGWALALYTDGLPAAAGNPDLNIPSWNFRSIYTGLYNEYRDSRPGMRPYPLVPAALALGAFAPMTEVRVVGGGIAYFELSGKHPNPQLLELRTGAPDSKLRIAIARLE